MRTLLVLVFLMLTACGGTLTDEQRKKVKRDMKDHALKKVSQADITEAAFTLGRSVSSLVEKVSISNAKKIDSIQAANHVKIVSLRPSDELMKGIEKQLIDAYTSGAGSAEISDNIQRLGTDSILYTKPIMKELPDGSLQFNYAIGVRMSKREVVITIKE